MKALFFISAIFFYSCSNPKSPDPEIKIIHDTVYVSVKSETPISTLPVSDCIPRLNKLSKINDSLSAKLFVSNFKINKVKFYLNICLKNSSQDKFLKGWIRRAVQ